MSVADSNQALTEVIWAGAKLEGGGGVGACVCVSKGAGQEVFHSFPVNRVGLAAASPPTDQGGLHSCCCRKKSEKPACQEGGCVCDYG